jgi:hypothetical protein
MQLTYEGFLDRYKDKWSYPYERYGSKAYQDDKTKPRLSVTWDVGGAHGGDCWGASPRSYMVSPDKEPELEKMDEILLEIAPAMSFLQYKKLAKYLHEEDHTSHEYYGNYTDHRTKFIEARDLFDALVDMGLINQEEEA